MLVEKPIGTLRPDIILHGKEDVFVEVAVTSFIGDGKFQKIQLGNHKTIEIDASGMSHCENPEALENMIIHGQLSKNIIFWPEEQHVIIANEQNDWKVWTAILLALAAVVGFFVYLKNKKKTGRNHNGKNRSTFRKKNNWRITL